MITLHHLNNSRSQRILWMLEELELDYQIQFYQRDPDTMLAPESLKKVHPLGKSPVISDGDKTLAESGAIIEYLAETYGAELLPARESEAFLQYRYWLHYAEGSLMPNYLLKLIFDKIAGSPVPFFVKPIVKTIVNKVNSGFLDANIRTHLGFVEQHLGQHPWFAGETFSPADIQMSYPMEATASRFGGGYPHIQAFVQKIQARPAYQRALKAAK